MTLQKQLVDLTVGDLAHLVDEKVTESETLDYKLEMYPRTDNGKREMLRDIASMANARGGYLLIGIREDNDRAVELVGIEAADVVQMRLLSSCQSGIHERINGLDAKPIPLPDGRAILAVLIPESTRVPHMVTFQDEDRLWIRHGRQKMRMSVEEIRQACSRVHNLFVDLETFLERQTEKAKSRAEPHIGIPILRCALAPLAVKEDRIDIGVRGLRDLMKSPPNMRPYGFTINWPLGIEVEPTMDGLRISISDLDALEVFRNGYAEFRVSFNRDTQIAEDKKENGSTVRLFSPIAVVEYTVSMVRFYRSLCRQEGIFGPYVVAWEILNARDVGLTSHPLSQSWRRHFGPRFWTESRHLTLPSFQIPNLSTPDRVAKIVLDRVWQSFGYENAPCFDKDGNFSPPKV